MKEPSPEPATGGNRRRLAFLAARCSAPATPRAFMHRRSVEKARIGRAGTATRIHAPRGRAGTPTLARGSAGTAARDRAPGGRA
jgi:hypothetical protein